MFDDILTKVTVPFTRKEEWQALAIPGYENPSAAVLLTGPPGVGKTHLAKRILKTVSGLPVANIPQLHMGELVSTKLGETEKMITLGFQNAIKRAQPKARPRAKVPIILFDEIDALAWSRSRVNADTMFMLSVVNTFLIQLDRFLEREGGLVVFTTNYPQLLDAAFLRRMTDTFELPLLQGGKAEKIWREYLPKPPFGPDSLPPVDQPTTPDKIRKWIYAEARQAFIEKRNMNYESWT